MKNTLIFFAACLLWGCSKNNNNNTPSAPTLTTSQTVDSVGITKGKIYSVQYVGNGISNKDTLIFNADNTITETCKGVSVTYTPVMFSLPSIAIKDTSGKYTGRFVYNFGVKLTADSAIGYFHNQIIKDTAIISSVIVANTSVKQKSIQFKWSNPAISGIFNNN